MFGPRLLSNVEVAARDVRVELTLPPSFALYTFHGEQHSTHPSEVEPQHLAPNDAMIFHQVLRTCAPDAVDPSWRVRAVARYEDPMTREPLESSFEASVARLLDSNAALLLKGDAVVAYAEALASGHDTCSQGGPLIVRGSDAERRMLRALAALEEQIALGDNAVGQSIAHLLTHWPQEFVYIQSGDKK